MSKHKFTADPDSSKGFFGRLNEYMESNVLQSNKTFICKHKKECEASCQPEGRSFAPGQLHHVGPLYDIKRDGKPFRIMVSGAEYGRMDDPRSVKERTDDIKELTPKNSHMIGTLRLLQMLFGEKPNDGMLKMDINDEQHPIFRCFSLANFLLCSAVQGDSPMSAFTNKMKENCTEHYQKTIEILQPQIIVLQGVRSREFFAEHYGVCLDFKESKIETIEVCGKNILVLPLCHPSYQRNAWGGANHKAITNYVKPAVDQLLKEYEKCV